jgi:hypothetical protein
MASVLGHAMALRTSSTAAAPRSASSASLPAAAPAVRLYHARHASTRVYFTHVHRRRPAQRLQRQPAGRCAGRQTGSRRTSHDPIGVVAAIRHTSIGCAQASWSGGKRPHKLDTYALCQS